MMSESFDEILHIACHLYLMHYINKSTIFYEIFASKYLILRFWQLYSDGGSSILNCVY